MTCYYTPLLVHIPSNNWSENIFAIRKGEFFLSVSQSTLSHFIKKGKFSSIYKLLFPSSSTGKESTCNAGDPGLILGLESFPGEAIGNTLPYSCLENPHGQRSLAGYSSQGRKELDMTEQLGTAHHMHGWLIHSITVLRSLVPVWHSPWHLHFTCLIPSCILCPRWDFQLISS